MADPVIRNPLYTTALTSGPFFRFSYAVCTELDLIEIETTIHVGVDLLHDKITTNFTNEILIGQGDRDL
jgi:hypothetical protein